jgi:hypothetical protein
MDLAMIARHGISSPDKESLDMKGACVSVAGALIFLFCLPAEARWPSDHRVENDILKHWKEKWPEQQVEYVKKNSGCEKAELEDKAYKKKTGKSRMLKACLIKADVYVVRGYRYFIYQDTYIYYVRRKLRSVQLGELRKAWKEGGVPAPSQEQAVTMLKLLASEKLGTAEVKVVIKEMGRPRPYGDFYRVTILVDLSITKEGKQEKRESLFATLQSDGTDWKPIRELAF